MSSTQQHRLRPVPKQQTEQYAISNPYGLCQTPDVYREIMANYPPLRDDMSFQRLFEYLFLGPARFDNSDRIIVDSHTLARIEGKLKEWMAGNYNSEAFMVRFRDVTGINLKWSEHLPPIKLKKGEQKRTIGPPRARVILELGIPEDLLARINKGIYESNNLVYFPSGLKRTSERLEARYARTLADAAQAGRLNFRCEEQRMIAGMLHAVPASKYVSVVNTYKNEAYTRLDGLCGIIGDKRRHSEGKPRQRRILNCIVSDPKPPYHRVNNSYRLFSSGLTVIDRRVRQALTPTWVELDLRAAHAAIASVLWDIFPLWEKLNNGVSLWSYLLDFLGVESELWPRVKPCVKTAFYAMLYGMEKNAIDYVFWKNLEREFKQEIKQGGKRPYIPNRLIDNDLVQEILQAREAEMERVAANGGTLTPFKWLALEDDWHTEDGDDIGKTLRRHLSHVASTYELKLLAPVFEVAAGRADRDVTIMLYQFDGVSIDVRPSRQERVVTAMQRAVQGVADRYGMPTNLELADMKERGVTAEWG